MSNFFDDYGMLHAYPEQLGENPILFSLIYDILCYKLNGHHFYDKRQVQKFIRAHKTSDGSYKQSPNAPDTDPISHDNMTAIMIFSYIYGLDFHKDADTDHLWHPRDIMFYAILRKSLCAKTTKPALKLMCKASIAKKWKIRPNVWERPELYWKRAIGKIKVIDDVIYDSSEGEYTMYYTEEGVEGLQIWRRKMLHSDGKLLWWLRQQIMPLGVDIDIVKYLEIYFKDEKNPIRKLIASQSSDFYHRLSLELDTARSL